MCRMRITAAGDIPAAIWRVISGVSVVMIPGRDERRSVRAAERAVNVALRFDAAIALLLVERGDRFVGFDAGVALAELACAATAVGGGFGFYDFGYVASRQPAARRADEVAIVAFVGAQRRIAGEARLRALRLQATVVLVADLRAIDAALWR